ncbi:MAG: cobalamin B12-binding domain-containing protein [Desulfobacteraceae bacterium]|nr:cobalamin B12-binding domain-containing protein [Desulfobacteraceae bacterium]
MARQKRIIVGKMGLDSHDNGLRIIAKWLMDIGYEVIYAGLYNTSERLVQMAVQEDADVMGISFLGGEHLYYTRELIQRLSHGDMDHIKLVVGGVIPPDDVVGLKKAGADAVFVPGTTKQTILDTMEGLFD